MIITSLTNNKVKQWVKYKERKYREKDQMFLIEGEHLIQEAHKARLIEYLIILQGTESMFQEYAVYEVTTEIMKKLNDSVSGTSIMAVCHYPDMQVKNRNKIILLDDVQDPGNVGTIIRTAYSFGYDLVYLSEKCADIFNDKVIRSTQGALFHIPIYRGELLAYIDDLKKDGIYLYATSLQNAKPLSEVKVQTPCAIVFGNEGAGVSLSVLNKADVSVFIEMINFESLNVAVAAGICMYHFR